MERWNNKVAVVTGASSGIGAATALDLVRAGLVVVGLARRVERVEELRSRLPPALQSKLHAYKCDVSSLESVNEAFDRIIKSLGGVDVLVNNAGTFRTGQLISQDPADLEQVLQTNVMGAVYCIQRAVKSMKQRKIDGHIILINSIAGHQVSSPPDEWSGVTYSIYPATKFAITAINEVLRQELRKDTKIRVTSISPGVVDTEIIPDEMKSTVSAMLNSEDISNAILYVLSTPPHVQVHEMIIKPVGEVI